MKLVVRPPRRETRSPNNPGILDNSLIEGACTSHGRSPVPRWILRNGKHAGARGEGPWIAVLLTAQLLLGLVAGIPPRHPDSTQFDNRLVENLSPPSFDENVRVTDGSSPFSNQVEPYVVIDSHGALFVGWKEANAPDGPGRRVGFARSEDGGVTWSPNVLMDRRASTRFQSDPWLAVDDADRLYYSRMEFESGLVNGVVVSYSDDAGRSWSRIGEVDDQPGFADKDSIATDGHTVYVAYDDISNQDGNTSVRFARSVDRGETWSPTVAVGGGAAIPGLPVIAAQPNGTVYLAGWDARNILVARSGDRGATWGTPMRVNAMEGSASYNESYYWWLSLPSIVTDSQGRVYVAWADWGTGDMDVLVSRSDDGGASWSLPGRINDDSSGREQRMVSLAVDPTDRLHAAWYDNRTGNLNVFYSSSSDGGESWTPNVRVTTAETPSTFQRPGDYLGLAADSEGNAFIVWTDGRGGDLDIYFATSRDREAPKVTILIPMEGQLLPSSELVVSGTAGDNVGVAMVEVSTDNGTTWIPANGTSYWSAVLQISPGETGIVARATDGAGNEAFDSVTVTRRLPEDSPLPTAPPPPILFFVLLGLGVAAAGPLLWLVRKRIVQDRR